jgi:hypothetical protein
VHEVEVCKDGELAHKRGLFLTELIGLGGGIIFDRTTPFSKKVDG